MFVSSRKGSDGAPYRPMAGRLLAGRRAEALTALLIRFIYLSKYYQTYYLMQVVVFRPGKTEDPRNYTYRHKYMGRAQGNDQVKRMPTLMMSPGETFCFASGSPRTSWPLRRIQKPHSALSSSVCHSPNRARYVPAMRPLLSSNFARGSDPKTSTTFRSSGPAVIFTSSTSRGRGRKNAPTLAPIVPRNFRRSCIVFSIAKKPVHAGGWIGRP